MRESEGYDGEDVCEREWVGVEVKIGDGMLE